MSLWSSVTDFFTPSKTSKEYASDAATHAADASSNVTNFLSNGAKALWSACSVGKDALTGSAIYKFVGGELFGIYSGSALGSLLLPELSLASISSKALLTCMIAHPVATLSATMLASVALHPEHVKDLIVNSFATLVDAVEIVKESALFAKDSAATAYAGIYEAGVATKEGIKKILAKDTSEFNLEKDIEMEEFLSENESKFDQHSVELVIAGVDSNAGEVVDYLV